MGSSSSNRSGQLLGLIRNIPPRGWRDALFQLGLFWVAYTGYQLVRGIAEARDAVAFANGERIIELEKALGAFFEPGFQAAMMDFGWLIDAASWAYLNTQIVITTGFIAWIYLRRNDHFYFVRNMFLVAMGLALVGYALYPTAPPRLITEAGFTDTVALFTGVTEEGNAASVFWNQFAAVPSMHICFALMIAVPGLRLSRNVLARGFWAAYPALVFFVVVVTANHYWFDAAAGALVASVAAIAAHRLARMQPERWAWPAESQPAAEAEPAREAVT
jgi:hypothetical protein